MKKGGVTMERDDEDVRLIDYWLASLEKEAGQDEPASQCECDADKTNTDHPTWCPMSVN
jgi:hypothetical protein